MTFPELTFIERLEKALAAENIVILSSAEEISSRFVGVMYQVKRGRWEARFALRTAAFNRPDLIPKIVENVSRQMSDKGSKRKGSL